jgi:hypothetical protein
MIRLLLFAALLSALPVEAGKISVGDPLPQLAIDDRGELLFDGEDFSYRPWQHPGGLGKPHVLQYMAGTMSARNQTRAFTDSLEANIPYEKYHVTTILNLDQALWGTTGFVMGKARSNKEKYPRATLVLDETGQGQKTWALSEKDAAVIIMDAGGTVLFFQQGAMTDDDIDTTLELIRQQLN